MLVRVQKSSRRLELSAPAWNLVFDADRPWVVSLAAGTGRPIADLFLGSSVDTAAGRDELETPPPPVLTRDETSLSVTCTARSSRWRVKRYVFRCTEADVGYHVEVEGEGRIACCRLCHGFLARDVELLGLGPSYFRAGYERPFRDLVRGTRARYEALYTARPTAAEHDCVPWWEDSEIDLRDDPARHGGLDSFLPAPWLFALDLGADQPWATVGLAPGTDQLDFGSFALRGGESLGFELGYAGLPVEETWRSPELVFTVGARDLYGAFRSHAEALRRRGLLDDVRPPQPKWWQRPIFDGAGDQQALRGTHSAEAECTLANYLDSLALLKGHGLEPGALWVGPGWMLPDAPGEPELGRWPDLRGFIDRGHQEGRKTVLAWPLRLKPPAGVLPSPRHEPYRQWLAERVAAVLSPDGLDADGLTMADSAWPDGQWLHDSLALIREAARAVKPDALLAAPTINSAYADVVDLVPLGSLWTDRTSVTGALRHRATIARSASSAWLLGISDRSAPGRAAWREVLELQRALGVPMLSYARCLEQTGEPLEAEDFALVRRVWEELP